jgi:hypothetical protein
MPQQEPYWSLPYTYNGSHLQQFDTLGYSDLAQHLVFLHENWIQPYAAPEQMCVKVKKAQHDSGRFPVLCFDTNHLPYCDVKQILNREIGENNYFMLVSDPQHDCDKNTGYWPYFLAAIYPYKNYQADRPKHNRISFLAGVLRYHRLKLWQSVRNYITSTDVVVINKFLENNYENSFDHQQVSLESARQLLQQSLPELPWSNQPDLIDTNDQNLLNSSRTWDNAHPAYNAAINITAETITGNDIMITEKTWKAYRSGCLVVNFGPTAAPLYLKQMGLETWEEYDACLGIDDKINMITELWQRNDIQHIYAKNIEMIKHNQNLVNNINFIKKQSQPAAEKIQAWIR